MAKRTNSRACKAKRKVVYTIKAKGKSLPDITVDKIKHWYNVINIAAFGGKLTIPTIEFARTQMTYGYIETTDNRMRIIRIRISTRIKTVKLFMSTLAHEMVHQWQHMVGCKLNHGKTFLQWKAYFQYHMGLSI